MLRRAGLFPAALALLVSACSSAPEEDEEGTDEGEARTCRIPRYERKLDFARRENAIQAIKRSAVEEGVPNAALLVAGIGAHETGLTHCWKDARQFCQGPHSASCGGPVLAGSGDGPCANRQGGLGMFQFDSGTHDQTLRAYTKDILSETGNVRAGFRTILMKLRICTVGPGVQTDWEARQWLESVRVGTPEYDQYLDAMARCYNGAPVNSCRFKQVRAAYDAATKYLLEDGGEAFWYSAPSTQ
jgi:hypothetical protein